MLIPSPLQGWTSVSRKPHGGRNRGEERAWIGKDMYGPVSGDTHRTSQEHGVLGEVISNSQKPRVLGEAVPNLQAPKNCLSY